MIVVDSSVAISWVLPDEDSEVARRALQLVRVAGMCAPDIFWYEFRNALIVSERRGRFLVEETTLAISVLTAIDPGISNNYSDIELMRIARQRQLSVYDAAYLALAVTTSFQLATLDRNLAQAAAEEGVPVVL